MGLSDSSRQRNRLSTMENIFVWLVGMEMSVYCEVFSPAVRSDDSADGRCLKLEEKQKIFATSLPRG